MFNGQLKPNSKIIHALSLTPTFNTKLYLKKHHVPSRALQFSVPYPDPTILSNDIKSTRLAVTRTSTAAEMCTLTRRMHLAVQRHSLLLLFKLIGLRRVAERPFRACTGASGN
eukprot:6206076-Pleurochrysis_carterae.AAC.2